MKKEKRSEISINRETNGFCENGKPISYIRAVSLWEEVGKHDWTAGAYEKMLRIQVRRDLGLFKSIPI